jgi:DMSO/TMAO reductase YedYZ molybdopterin-dependent catalytic subunit
MPSTKMTRPRPALAGLCGLLAGAVTVAVAELLAAVLDAIGAGGGQAGPVLAVGDAVVDRTPGWLKDFAISTFGAHDKLVLLVSIGAVLTAAAVLAGLLAARRPAVGAALVVVLGAVAVSAALTRPSARLVDAVPTLVGTAAGVVTLRGLLGRAPVEGATSRRGFLRAAGAVGTLAVLGAAASRFVGGRADTAARSRAAVRLPEPVERVSVPDGVQLPVDAITPWRTAPRDFYRVDTALRVPQVSTGEWSLRVHGLVERELSLTYDELLAKPLVERAITLTCVSNEVGGRLLGNAVWLGYPVADLLADLGVDGSADMVLSTSVDGMTISTPLAHLTRDRDALLAVAMNGEPLPPEHGFPVRMVVPGLYGYVSATKWVTDLRVTRFADDEAYWTSRGYAAKAPIKASSRIDVPRSFAKLPAGRTAVAGMAWAQGVGVAGVQVRVDRGPWREARLGAVPADTTWVQWVYEWDAEPGTHTLECRLVAADGSVQVEQRRGVRPDGSTGLDSKSVTVS